MRTISALVSMLETFCTAWRERDAQEAPERGPNLAYRLSQDSDAFECLDTLDPGPETLHTGNVFTPKSPNNLSHLVATADAVPYLTKRIQTFQGAFSKIWLVKLLIIAINHRLSQTRASFIARRIADMNKDLLDSVKPPPSCMAKSSTSLFRTSTQNFPASFNFLA
jgi:hypothetical protein